MALLDILSAKRKPQDKDIKNLQPVSTVGTEIFSGEFFEEYLGEIKGNEGAKIYDKMRRSSDQVSMLLNLMKTPIVNATWSVDFKEDTEENKKIKEFIEFSLFEQIDFNQFLEEALTMFEYGHSVFEVVYTPLIRHITYPQTITLKKLSFIDPKTIEEWHVHHNGELRSIRQLVQGDLDVDVKIPASKLMTLNIGREGANYEGRSLLRPIYGNWKRKQEYLRIEAIGTERTSMGTPVGILAKGEDPKKSKLQKILSSFTTHQRSSVVVPHGTEIKNFDITFNAEAIRKTINAERLGMSQAFLAGFMELGNNSGSGSFALSTNLMNIFLGSVQTPANKVATALNKCVIKTLVDANFGPQATYPKLKVSNITDRLGKEFIEMIAVMTDKGYVNATDEMKEFIHKKLNLPESELEEEIEQGEELEDNVDNSVDKDVNNSTTEESKEVEQTDMSLDFAANNKNEAVKLIDKQRKELESLMSKELTARRDKMLESTKSMMKKGESRTKIVSQKLPASKAYRDLVFDFLVDVSIKATNQAKREVGVSVELASKEDLAKLTPKSKERLRAEINLIIDTQESDLVKNLMFPYNNVVDNTDSADKVISDMKDGSDKFLNGPSLGVGAANFTSNAVNNARNDVYQTPEVFAVIESFTIVNPSPKAAICKQLAGRTITKEQYSNGDLPPYHHNCNSIVVANKAGAKGNPKINPLGLSYTGSPEQVESIIKSKTF